MTQETARGSERFLGAAVATQLERILFMEGSGEPAEMTELNRDLRLMGDAAAVPSG